MPFTYPYIAAGQEPNIRDQQVTVTYDARGSSQEPNIRDGQQPFTGDSRNPNIGNTRVPFTYPFRTPTTYDHRSPFTYQRNSSRQPNTYDHRSPFRQPNTYDFRTPSTYDQGHHIDNLTHIIYRHLVILRIRLHIRLLQMQQVIVDNHLHIFYYQCYGHSRAPFTYPFTTNAS